MGTPITATDAIVAVTLRGVDEPYPTPLKSLQPPLSRADELAVVHRVFDTYAEGVIKEGSERDLYEVMRILVWLDPARAIELLNDQRLQPWQPNDLRLTLATQLVRQDEKEARGLIEAIPDTNMRSYAYSEASFALPDSARALKLDLLNESLVAGRAVVDPENRVLRLADIGGRLFDLGQTEEATNVVQERAGHGHQIWRYRHERVGTGKAGGGARTGRPSRLLEAARGDGTGTRTRPVPRPYRP